MTRRARAAGDEIDAALRPLGLASLGRFAPAVADGAPPGTGTLVLVGPDGGAMWPVFSAAPEAQDDAPDPLDRWSRRVLGGVAERLGGAALFPFDGPPWPPFFRWALKAAAVWPSPIGPLVHARRGLWVSFRGALALPQRCDAAAPAGGAAPCATCAAPCRTACPVGAFAAQGYDAAACRAHLAAPEGAVCRDGGCLARRVCPVGRDLAPGPAQAAFHLAAFARAAPPREGQPAPEPRNSTS